MEPVLIDAQEEHLKEKEFAYLAVQIVMNAKINLNALFAKINSY
jgi:hypothetical protein